MQNALAALRPRTIPAPRSASASRSRRVSETERRRHAGAGEALAYEFPQAHEDKRIDVGFHEQLDYHGRALGCRV